MLTINRARALLQKGNLQEQRNKDFTLRLTTSLLLVLIAGFLSGFISCKVIADPLSSIAKEQCRRTPAINAFSRNNQ